MRGKNGITLIALIITVIVMLILVAVTVSVVINSNLIGTAQNATDATKQAYEQEGSLTKITIGGVTYPSLEAYTTGWDAGSGVNYPKLAQGMKAVYWDNSGNEIVQGEEKFNWNSWFDYKAQTGTTDGESRWANAKTEDGSYWVWIPRFEYKITPTTDTTPSETNAGTIDVRFISTDVKQGSQGYTTTNGITTSSDGYIIHPAFTSNVDVGGFGKELTGFWVAKYEMSMEKSTDNGLTWNTVTLSTDATVDDTENGNIATTNAGNSNYVRAVSKPNVSSWRWINIANMYTNSYYYDRTKDSHLIKNSEWGAVVYLTHSQYGRNGNEVTINDDNEFITGGGNSENDNYVTNIVQSSTGNISGAYDLSGGANDRVAVYNDGYYENGGYFGGIGGSTNLNYKPVNGVHFAYEANGKSSKYATKYYNDTEQYYIGQDVGERYLSFEAFEEAGKIVSIKGDACKEISVTYAKAWFNDYSYFMFLKYPFLDRGGYFGDGSSAGIFFSYFCYGNSNFGTSFRAVLVP